ncbi:MAG: hypothetical protein CMJ82_14810, partial [Planctomycetaceae bacterium]|nr:hypothetical protein [Planctomycetaceae bacterium]
FFSIAGAFTHPGCIGRMRGIAFGIAGGILLEFLQKKAPKMPVGSQGGRGFRLSLRERLDYWAS